MRIQRVDNLSFERKPNRAEMKVYTQSLNSGLDLLGKQVDLILHNASAPSMAKDNVGIGSLFSKTTSQKLIPFLKAHAFRHIQQEPNGLRKFGDNSPYSPESEAKNIFMIPLEKLASEEYGNILSKKTFNKLVRLNPNRDRVDYQYIRSAYSIALREAFDNSRDSKELKEFKKRNQDSLEASAIFRIISNINEERGSQEWSQLDQNLYLDKDSQASKARIKELKTKYKDEYDFFFFQQMLLEKENQKSNQVAQETGIKIIGDSPVAPSAVESWTNKNLFIKGKALGCPPDAFSTRGQRWDFPYYNPKEIFNPDGSLGKAGELLKKKYEKYFESFPGGLRIDHVIGLVDPFIYTTSEEMTNKNSGRIYSRPNSIYKKNNTEEYGALLTKIIIPAAKKFGIDIDSIICEDLGDFNQPTQDVMKKYNLSGIAVTQFDYRGSTIPAKNTIMLGSHDNQSFLEFIDDLFDYSKNQNKKDRFMRKTEYLAEDTAPQNATKEEIKKYKQEIRTDKTKFMLASFTELFTSPAKRVQIFFTDLWGIPKTYNRPGTQKGNWEIRVGENFEKEYYQKAAEGKAPNFAEIIARALRQRGLDKGNEQLMKNLDDSAKIIAEKA